jgi:protein TonB
VSVEVKEVTTMKLKKMISPKRLGGAVFWSTVAHLTVVLGIVISNMISPTTQVVEEDYLDLGYEMFDAPPDQMEQVNLGRKVAEVAPEVKDIAPKDSVRELQDESSTIAGTQKATAVADTGTGGTGVAAAPYFKIKPKYPKAALMSGEEGWVLFSVDVTESGEVENVRVVDGEKKDVFQLEARRAVSKWKYRPFVDTAGTPIKKRDHLVRVEFKLEDSESI